MNELDIAIQTINNNICKNIAESLDRGFISQNILSQMRNFVEHISLKLYCVDNKCDMSLNYDNLKIGNNHVRSNSKYIFLREFHELLQISVSHYTLDENNSERLMLKYYEYLLRIKMLVSNNLGFEVLSNLSDFPLEQDSQLLDYHKIIANAIADDSLPYKRISYSDRYYIHKVRPFFVDEKIYYEVTYSIASDNISKFDRMIAFTDKPILTNYATLLWVKKVEISMFGEIMPIFIIDGWEVSIRPCEINKLRDIFNIDFPDIQTSYIEYRNLMHFIQQFRMNLVDLIDLDDKLYQSAKKLILKNSRVMRIFLILDKAREMCQQNAEGSRIARYLLYTMNNRLLKTQYISEKWLSGGNPKLSYLRLDWKCVPFDQMPFDAALKNHNPRLIDLLHCISQDGREDELFARYIKNNSEIRGKLFTPVNEIKHFKDINGLIHSYNSKLYYKHRNRELCMDKGHVFISGYKNDVVFVIRRLQGLSKRGISGYTNSIDSWLKEAPRGIDDEVKINCLKTVFENSRVGLIYGAAGTGKSTLVNYIASYFSSKEKLFLANTNTAVDNLRRKVVTPKSEFSTIAKIIAKKDISQCDLLVIDESSTVSNSDMVKILEKIDFELLLIVGDIYQIESIRFGNWFDIAQYYLPKCKFELTNTYRTSQERLLAVWDKVRNIERDLLEHITRGNFSRELDTDIFDNFSENEIILCLNYDGLYGINNINTFMQANNPSPGIIWGTSVYKKGDPILFNDSLRFSPLIYNNVKGVIQEIYLASDESTITFDVKLLDLKITELDLKEYSDLQFIGNDNEGKSIVRFSVNKHGSTDYDSNDLYTLVPFQISYAISIHKAQGLEYDSVKIIITNESEENISHNIFYTAITRAKQSLRIYWSPESEKSILNSLEKRDNAKDGNFLKIFM
ncbi:TPA: AAA family ATPase [Streptococcus suis]|nr:AAA family ATPase [Streptococcus suis]